VTAEEKSATRGASAPPLSPYFVNLPVDALLIGGVSLLVYLALRLWGGTARTEAAWTLAGYLVWVINWPHFSATNYRLYGSRAYIKQYPVTATVTPFLVLAAVVGSFASPLVIAPYFIKVFLLWSPYHFSGQTIGISLLYARRGGYAVGKVQRLAFTTFVYGTFLLGSARAEVGLANGEYFGVPYPSFGLPPSVPVAIEAMVWVAAIVLALSVIGRAFKEKRLPPVLFLLPCITQYMWFVGGTGIPNYTEFVPAFHSLQYLLIAWSMQLKEKADRSDVVPGRSYVTKESARWFLLNVVGGAILFSFLPYFATLLGVSVPLASGVVIASVQIHHFFVDGVIWKLRSASVVSPLLVNIPQMIAEADRPRAASDAIGVVQPDKEAA
jgi:hypothetical protein